MNIQDLCTSSLQGVSFAQALIEHLLPRSLQEISVQDLYERSPRTISQDLCKRSLCRIPVQILSAQDLCERSLNEISVQALYAESLSKISVRDLLARSLQEISIQDLCARSLYKVSWQAHCKTSPGKISVTDLFTRFCPMSLYHISWQDRCWEISVQDLLERITTAAQRERCDTHKLTRMLHERCQNEHRATTRAARNIK